MSVRNLRPRLFRLHKTNPSFFYFSFEFLCFPFVRFSCHPYRRRSTLRIRCVKEEDAGSYECRPSNVLGTGSSAKSRVTVVRESRFPLPPANNINANSNGKLLPVILVNGPQRLLDCSTFPLNCHIECVRRFRCRQIRHRITYSPVCSWRRGVRLLVQHESI